MFNIHVAKPHGFCFGIDRAIELARNTSKKYKDNIYFLGEIVHNQHVVDWLSSELKIVTVASLDQIPKGSVVIIRAHGASPEVFKQALDKGLVVVDASCPLVLKSHQEVLKYTSQNKKIIFLCSSVTHDETVGVVGENPQMVTPVTLQDALDFKIDNPSDYVLLTQTTLSTIETQKVFGLLKEKYPQMLILPHICQATTDRQKSVIELAKSCDLIIIVGSPTSANSNSLKMVAESNGTTSYIIDNATELNSEWFKNCQNVGVSSGASTPESILNKVLQQIETYQKKKD